LPARTRSRRLRQKEGGVFREAWFRLVKPGKGTAAKACSVIHWENGDAEPVAAAADLPAAREASLNDPVNAPFGSLATVRSPPLPSEVVDAEVVEATQVRLCCFHALRWQSRLQ
jgi:hypothetical protein